MPLQLRDDTCDDALSRVLDITEIDSLLALEDLNNSSALLQLPSYEVQSHNRTLYVAQSEIAYDVDSKDYDIMCSDDATTCIILLISTRSGDTQRVLVTHLGSPKCVEGLVPYLDDMEKRTTVDIMPAFDVHICGGMDMQTNRTLYVSLMEVLLAREQATYYLETLTSHNSTVDTDKITHAVKMGFGFVRQSVVRHLLLEKDVSNDDTIFRIMPIYIPRELRGPAMIARELKTFTDDKLQCIHPIAFSSPTTGPRVKISHVDIHSIDSDIITYFRQVLPLPDETLLRYTSTSPLCEPKHFVAALRSSWELLLSLIDDDQQEADKEDLTCFRLQGSTANNEESVTVYELSPANEWLVCSS